MQRGVGEGGPDERALGGNDVGKLGAAAGVEDGGRARRGPGVGLEEAERPAGPCAPEALRGAEPRRFARVAFRTVAVAAQPAGQRQLLVRAEQQAGVAGGPGGLDGLIADGDRFGDAAELDQRVQLRPAGPG